MKTWIFCAVMAVALLFHCAAKADPAFDFHTGPCAFASPSSGSLGPVVCRGLVGTDIGGTYADGSSFSSAGLTLAKLLASTAVQETSISLTGCNGSTATINLALGTYFYCTVSSGAVTFLTSNVAASGMVSSFVLEITNGGSQTVNWMSGTKWPSGFAPALTSAGVDLLVCGTRDGAATWRCTMSELNSK